MDTHSTYKKIEKNDILRDSILKYAWKQFCKLGLRKVKVDEIAAHFSISKRTLYEMFEDKEQLIVACFEDQYQINKRKIEEIKRLSDNIMEKYITFFKERIKEMNGLNPSFYYEAIKYPKLLKFIEDTSIERNETAMFFIEQCVKEGYLRDEYDYSLILEAYNMQMEFIVKYDIFKKYSMDKIVNTLGAVLFRGCSTEKGLKLIDSMI